MKTKSQLRIKQENRRNEIKKCIEDGLTYNKIAEKFGVTKGRIIQLAKFMNINRREEKRVYYKELYKELYNNILIDLDNNLTPDDIKKKYKVSPFTINHALKKYSKEYKPISFIFKNKRNKSISDDYAKGLTAFEVIKKYDYITNNRYKVSGRGLVYKITKENGVNRWSKNKSADDILEAKKIIDYIVKNYRDKKTRLSFIKIADNLNKLGYKTITGKSFSYYIVRVKYYKYCKMK